LFYSARQQSKIEEYLMASSVFDRIRDVEHQKAKVERESLRQVKRILSELNKLGFDYRVVGSSRGNGAVRAVNRKSRTVKDAACKICGFRTARSHDARAHRGQAKKAPFTRKELAERGLRRV